MKGFAIILVVQGHVNYYYPACKLVVNMFMLKFDRWFVFILCAIGLYSIAVLRKLAQMDEGSTEIV